MAIKIENIQVEPVQVARRGEEWNDFLIALRDLQVGQSFVVKTMPSNYRLIVSAAQTLMNRHFISCKVEGGHRIGRDQ